MIYGTKGYKYFGIPIEHDTQKKEFSGTNFEIRNFADDLTECFSHHQGRT